MKTTTPILTTTHPINNLSLQYEYEKEPRGKGTRSIILTHQYLVLLNLKPRAQLETLPIQ